MAIEPKGQISPPSDLKEPIYPSIALDELSKNHRIYTVKSQVLRRL